MKHLQLSSRCFGCTQPNQTSKNLVKFGRHGGRAAATTRWLISHHFSEADLWAVSSLHASVIQQVCLNFHSPICPVVLEMPLCPKLVRTTGILRHQALVYAFKQAGGFLAMGCTWMQRDPGLGEVWLSIAICDKKKLQTWSETWWDKIFLPIAIPGRCLPSCQVQPPGSFSNETLACNSVGKERQAMGWRTQTNKGHEPITRMILGYLNWATGK